MSCILCLIVPKLLEVVSLIYLFLHFYSRMWLCFRTDIAKRDKPEGFSNTFDVGCRGFAPAYSINDYLNKHMGAGYLIAPEEAEDRRRYLGFTSRLPCNCPGDSRIQLLANYLRR